MTRENLKKGYRVQKKIDSFEDYFERVIIDTKHLRFLPVFSENEPQVLALQKELIAVYEKHRNIMLASYESLLDSL